MENKYFLLLLIPIAFILLIYGIDYASTYKDKKYCDLVRITEEGDSQLHPAYYQMREEAGDFIGGSSYSGSIRGKLKGWSLDYSYVDCEYSFRVKKGNISQEVFVSHEFIDNELMEWRDAKDKQKGTDGGEE